MSQDAATITVFSNVNNPFFRLNFPPNYSYSHKYFLSNYYNPNIIYIYEYDNDLKTCPCLDNKSILAPKSKYPV